MRLSDLVFFADKIDRLKSLVQSQSENIAPETPYIIRELQAEFGLVQKQIFELSSSIKDSHKVILGFIQHLEGQTLLMGKSNKDLAELLAKQISTGGEAQKPDEAIPGDVTEPPDE